MVTAERTEYNRLWQRGSKRKAWLERNRERLREYHAEWYQQKKASGKLRNQYLEHKEAGLCPTCGKETPQNYRKVRCPDCISRKRKHSSVKRAYLKQKAIEYLGGKCADCHQTFECVAIYEFHHRHGEQKDYPISWAISSHLPDFETMITELDKCDLLCANCHRVRHFHEKGV